MPVDGAAAEEAPDGITGVVVDREQLAVPSRTGRDRRWQYTASTQGIRLGLTRTVAEQQRLGCPRVGSIDAGGERWIEAEHEQWALRRWAVMRCRIVAGLWRSEQERQSTARRRGLWMSTGWVDVGFDLFFLSFFLFQSLRAVLFFSNLSSFVSFSIFFFSVSILHKFVIDDDVAVMVVVIAELVGEALRWRLQRRRLEGLGEGNEHGLGCGLALNLQVHG
jgi:hypothetical protein